MANRGAHFRPVHIASGFTSPATSVRPLALPAGDATPLPKEDAAQKTLFRRNHDASTVTGTIEELLEEQLVAVERALTFNRVIAQRMARQGFHNVSGAANPDLGTPCPPRAPVPTPETKGSTSEMPTPLPSRTVNGALSVGETLARCQALLSIKPGDLSIPLLNRAKNESWSAADALANALPSPTSSVASWSSANQYQIQNEMGRRVTFDSENEEEMARTESEYKRGKSQRVLHLFPSVEGIKEMVLDSLGEKHFEAVSLYYETGVWQALARSNIFNNISLSVIVLNTVWIAIDTDLNKAEILCQAAPIFQIVENLFCTFFVFEMMVRVLAFKKMRDSLRDGWLAFDIALVATMVWETWFVVAWFLLMGANGDKPGNRASSVLRIFRVFRLTRVARTARLVGNVPELLILAKGMSVAVRSVAAVLCLLGLVIYIFSIIFTDMLGQTELGIGYFETVLQSMNTLLVQVVSGFDADLVKKLMLGDLTCYFVFLAYFLIASLTVMNMLIGILCDVVSNVASDERETSFVLEVEGLVGKLMQDLDVDGSKTLCKTEFEQIIYNQAMMRVLHDQGVDVVGIVDFGTFLFQECEELSFADFLSLVVQFRESKQATMKDVMDLRKYLARELSCLESRLLEIIVHYDSSIAPACQLARPSV